MCHIEPGSLGHKYVSSERFDLMLGCVTLITICSFYGSASDLLTVELVEVEWPHRSGELVTLRLRWDPRSR